jgi:hypothetical protein
VTAQAEQTTDYVPARWLRLVVVLWFGPHWWATHLGVTYLVVPETCELDIQWTLHLITLACLAGTAVGAWASVGLLRRATPLRAADRYALRDGYLAWVGLALNLFFAAVIIAENVPRWFLDACW